MTRLQIMAIAWIACLGIAACLAGAVLAVAAAFNTHGLFAALALSAVILSLVAAIIVFIIEDSK